METDSILTNLKLLIIGESGVGKSSLLLRFTDDAFDPEQVGLLQNWILNFYLELVFAFYLISTKNNSRHS
jgi:GTPase SAR1 family protein